MTVIIREASTEVDHIAGELIRDHYPLLRDANIAFAFREEAPVTDGVPTLAHTAKVSQVAHVFMDYDFLTWIAQDEYMRMDESRRRALIDHELCHMGGNIDDGWKIRTHDIGDFSSILARHGLWNKQLAIYLAPVANQLKLPIEDAHPEPARGSVTTIAFSAEDIKKIEQMAAHVIGAERRVEVSND
jgi:hypothetical protein